MSDIAPWRLNLLRVAYAIIFIGIAVVIWPLLLVHASDWPLMNSVVAAMLAAVSLLAALGLRYPLQLLPVLLFEFAWKAIWLGAVALPLWRAGQLDPRTMQTVAECALVVILIPLIPWDHVVRAYVTEPGARWRRAAAGEA